jgi:hypothetical protein
MGLFKNQFGESEDEMEKPEHSTKPTDFDLLFAGDIDDHFLFGMKFTKYVHLINTLLIIVLQVRTSLCLDSKILVPAITSVQKLLLLICNFQLHIGVIRFIL